MKLVSYNDVWIVFFLKQYLGQYNIFTKNIRELSEVSETDSPLKAHYSLRKYWEDDKMWIIIEILEIL